MTITTICAAIVAALSAARLTRLLVHDHFPPVAAVRHWYVRHTNDDWGLLFLCHWCMSAWPSLAIVVTGWLAWGEPGWGAVWWLFNAWMATTYVAGMIVERDGGTEGPADHEH